MLRSSMLFRNKRILKKTDQLIKRAYGPIELVSWLAELPCDHEVLGSIPAISKLFSGEPSALKNFDVRALGEKNGGKKVTRAMLLLQP